MVIGWDRLKNRLPSVILVTWEIEIGNIVIQGQLRQLVLKTPNSEIPTA
jgi:hypothetical protein